VSGRSAAHNAARTSDSRPPDGRRVRTMHSLPREFSPTQPDELLRASSRVLQ